MQSLTLLLKLVASLGGVLGLIWLLARTAQKRGWASGAGTAKPIRVVARHNLTKTSSVAVVRVGDRELLLGIGAHGVNILVDEEAGGLLTVTDPVTSGAHARRALPAALPSRQVAPVLAADGSARATGLPSSARTPMLDRLRARTVRH